MVTGEAPRSAPQKPAIELVGVGKRYGDKDVLRDVNIDIYQGEFLVVLGPSGCGKSTLLKLVAGLEVVTSGEIYIGGKLANYVRPKDRDVAMVFQNYALYPHKRVRENLAFPLRMRKTARAEMDRRVLDVARMLHLEPYLESFPEQLSGGQRQRVALGRAVIRNPVAFLMDEPLSNLDALLRAQTRDELLKIHRRVGHTTVYVTHDQVEAMTMADRMVVMHDAAVQQIGVPFEVFNRPANTFVATFVGTPQMNLMSGRLEPVDGGTVFVAQGFRCRLPISALPAGDKSVTIGIRPEDVRLTLSGGDGPHGRVGLVELLGSDTIVSISVAEDQSWKVRVPATTRIREGEIVGFDLPVDRIHVFDAFGARLPTDAELSAAIPAQGNVAASQLTS